LRALWKAHIETRKSALSAVAFVTQYWEAARTSGCFELMSDVPVLPAHLLSFVSATPIRLRDGEEEFMSACDRPIFREQVESETLTLWRCFDADSSECKDGYLRLMWAEKQHALFVDACLPCDHWVEAWLRDLEEEALRVEGPLLAQGEFHGNWVSGDIRLYDALRVTLGGVTHELTEAAVMESDWNYTFLVPQTCPSPGYVLRQASA
jgi:hypothetical protein